MLGNRVTAIVYCGISVAPAAISPRHVPPSLWDKLSGARVNVGPFAVTVSGVSP